MSGIERVGEDILSDTGKPTFACELVASLVLDGFWSPEQVQQARQRVQHYIDAWQPHEHPLVAFTTAYDNVLSL